MRLVRWWYATAFVVATTTTTKTWALTIPSSSRPLSMTMKTPSFHSPTKSSKTKKKSEFLGLDDDVHIGGAKFWLRDHDQDEENNDKGMSTSPSSTFWPMDITSTTTNIATTTAAAASATALVMIITSFPETALAASSSFSMGDMDPQSFQPVCPASDVFYRFLQGTTQAVVGEKSFLEYGPLIAGGLLRIRLELCVVESFFKEAVGPFIEQNGYAWILPIHETVETFLAGTIFALAATFILVGSTKILTVISTYADFFVGFPMRVLGGFAFDRARGKPVTLDVGIGPFKTRLVGPPEKKEEPGNGLATASTSAESDNNVLIEKLDNPVVLIVIAVSGAFKVLGQGLGIVRDVMDGLDVFVGKYLVLVATAYIGIKFLHFKVFPDIIAF